jgi:SAM-dependent methyltransferase
MLHKILQEFCKTSLQLDSDMRMHSAAPLRSEQAYWDASAETYERDFADTLVGKSRRRTVWCELDRVFHAGQRILELNCGTGIDAVHLAERGIRVMACDISPRMIELSWERVRSANVQNLVDLRVLPNEDIDSLFSEGPFDGAFSNFSGLNCVDDLSAVARNLAHLLKPSATAVLCMLGRFVPWEMAWFLAHGDPQRAVRRLRRSPISQPDMQPVRVHYFSLNEIDAAFAEGFRLTSWMGVGVSVPPSYMEPWARRFAGVTKMLARLDPFLGRIPLVRATADCILVRYSRHEQREGR